ncbi:nicotinate phosphoribosyltransferase [cf. Phormidesmis sp. LEGE 11477]|uniref:nicotinate phosphoribosyltransferase n=1 Tax=cf. Phormidesmis sp. LEGE 11477 TaxID=1828680 RepID=UPI00351D5CB0
MLASQANSLRTALAAETNLDTRRMRSHSIDLSASQLSVFPDEYGLLSDLYQLTMSACYTGEEIANTPASFELFTRRLPADYGYLIVMGLEQGLDYLQNLSFSPKQILDLQKTALFDDAPNSFWRLLEDFRFEGEVWAMPEGTAVFANEPMLRIEAPLWQAQIAETYLLNTLNYQTLIGTRAARLRQAAGPKAKLYEFGTRRAFSPQASLWAARAAIAGGIDATSNVLAALKLGRQPVGTMAHALVMAISALEGGEDEAFEAFHRYFPAAPLLIDTYDTVAAAKRLAQKVADGLSLNGVRIDSGDLVQVCQQVRSHLPDIPIFASGDLDEYAVERLRAEDACIDGYGLGTKLVTGAPVNGVYKLVEIDGIPVMKESHGKLTYPGCKQVFRQYQDGQIIGDRLALAIESTQQGEVPLLKRVMHDGMRISESESLDNIAARTAETMQALPESVRRLQTPEPLTIELSSGLESLIQSTQKRSL